MALRRTHLGEEDGKTIQTMLRLARLCRMQWDFVVAQALFNRALEISRKLHGDDHPDTLAALHGMASLLNSEGRNAEAEQLLLKVVQGRRRVLGEDHPDTLKSGGYLVVTYMNQGKFEQAAELLPDLVSAHVRTLGEDHHETLTIMTVEARSLAQAQKYPQAESLQVKAVAGLRKTLGEYHTVVLRELTELGWFYHVQGKYAEEEAAHTQVLDATRRHPEYGTLQYAGEIAHLGMQLYYRQALGPAERLQRDCLGIREKLMPDDWLLFNSKAMLGNTLAAQKKYAEAEPLLLSGYDGMKVRENRIPEDARIRLVECIQGLIDLYAAWDKPDRAAEWRKKLEEAKHPNDHVQ